MSGRMVGEVLKYAPADLRAIEVLVLVAMAEAANDRDRIAAHGATTADLADKCRTTEGTIRNVTSELRRRGLIVALFDKPRKGLAQNHRIPKMTDATRRAVLKASPHNDANGHAGVNGKRHPTMTLTTPT